MIDLITSGAGAIVVTSAALAVIGRGGWAFYRWCRRMEDILVYVDGEMRRNGGSTTRDAIARTEESVGAIKETVIDIDRRVQALEEAA